MAAEFSAEQAQARLPELLELAESGQDVVITRAGAPPVVLRCAAVRGGWTAPGDGTPGERAFDVGTDYSPAELGLSR